MSNIRRGAMAAAIVALIGVLAPGIVETGGSGISPEDQVGGPPPNESPQAALVANSIPVVSPERIAAMFAVYGVEPSLHANGTREDPQERFARIALEIESGLRTEAEVRQTIGVLATRLSNKAGNYDTEEAIAIVRVFFEDAGVPIRTSVESEAMRLKRIAEQIASGDRTFAEVERTVWDIAAGAIGFNPKAPARYGGSSARQASPSDSSGTASGPATSPTQAKLAASSDSPPSTTEPRPVTSTTRVVSSTTTTKATTTTTKATTTTTKATTTTTKPTTTTTKATTTTTKPATTTTKPASTASGVAVRPGESIQAAVNAHPAGTTFVIKAGVHKRQSVVAKAGNTFVGEPGAVLSGEGVTEVAFAGNNSDDVTIRGLVIEKYAAPLQKGVVRGGSGSHGWLVEDNEIRYNKGFGVNSGTGWRVVRNYIHHNQQYGLSGTGSNMVIEGNEVAFNNYQKTAGGDAGGSKWVHTTNLVVRNNYSHDNQGPGLWTDGNNVNTLYEGNRVENNAGPGIKHEVSCDAVIRNNTVVGNGFSRTAWVDGAGILVLNSPNVEVFGNVVRNNNDGIGGIHATRSHSTDRRCKIELRNFWVHDNTIEMQVGHTGVVTNFDGAVFTSMNNRFDRNTYILGSAAKYYRWGSAKTTAEWKSAGQDPNGTWK